MTLMKEGRKEGREGKGRCEGMARACKKGREEGRGKEGMAGWQHHPVILNALNAAQWLHLDG